MGVYRIDKDGSIHLVAANVTKHNGIIISPDQKTLYVANNDFPGNGNFWVLPDDASAVRPTTTSGLLIAFNLLPDGSLTFKSKLLDTGVDGMAIDVDGNLYLSMRDRVEVVSPNGKKLTEIKTQ